MLTVARLTKGQLTRIRLGAGDFLRRAWRFTKAAFWYAWLVAFVLMVLIGIGAITGAKRDTCRAEGGVFVSGFLSADECWAADGSHRIFPRSWQG